MSSYRVIKSVVVSSGDSAKHYFPGVLVEFSNDAAAELLALGKIAPEHLDPEAVETVAELEDDEDKPLKAHTVPELVEVAKKLGVPPDVAGHLKKAELVEAIERLTHSSD